MAASAAPWILRGILGSRAAGSLWPRLKPPYRNPFRGPSSTRTGTKYPKGGRINRITGVPLGGTPIITRDPGGIFNRNPMKTLYGGGLAATGAAGLAYGLLGDDEPSTDIPGKPYVPTPEPKEVVESTVPGQREAFQNKRRKRLKKGMKQILNQYMILSYVSPDEAGNFLKAAMEMMEADQDFNDDIYMQDAYDAVFQEGNMPTTGREAFKLLSPLIGHESAMEIAGEYADLAPDYKEYNYMTKQRIEMRDIMKLARDGYREEAVAALIQAWVSNSIAKPDNLKMGGVDESVWLEEAARQIDMSLGAGGIGGGDEEGFIKGITG